MQALEPQERPPRTLGEAGGGGGGGGGGVGGEVEWGEESTAPFDPQRDPPGGSQGSGGVTSKFVSQIEDGCLYEGEGVGAMPEGYGTETYPSGDSYEGCFLKGRVSKCVCVCVRARACVCVTHTHTHTHLLAAISPHAFARSLHAFGGRRLWPVSGWQYQLS